MNKSILKNKRIKIILSVLIIIISAFLLYHHTLHFNLTGLDDVNMVLSCSEAYKSKTAIIDAFKTDVLFGLGQTPYYRPMLSISFVLSFKIAGESVFFAHLVNVLLHCISALMIFFFASRYLFSLKTSFFAALLFAVHPATIYTVAWIPGRNDSIFLISFLAAFIFFIEYLRKNKSHLLIAHIFFTLICFFTRESGIMIPFVFIFYLITHKEDRKKPFIKYFPVYFLWALSIAFFLFMRKKHMPGSSLSLNMINLTADNMGMFFDYYSSMIFFRTPFAANTNIRIIIIGIIAMALTVFFAFYKKDYKDLSKNIFYLYFPLIFLLPNIISERLWFQGNRIYLPLFGIIVLFFSFIESCSQNKKFKKVALPLIIILILFASNITWSKAKTFDNNLSFWETILKESEKPDMTHYKFYIFSLIENEKYEQALNLALQVSKITYYSNSELNYLLAFSYFMNRDFENAAKYFELVLSKKDFAVSTTVTHLTIAYYILGEEEKFQSSFNYLSQILGQSPEDTLSYLNYYIATFSHENNVSLKPAT